MLQNSIITTTFPKSWRLKYLWLERIKIPFLFGSRQAIRNIEDSILI
jgi:hypothetical protein